MAEVGAFPKRVAMPATFGPSSRAWLWVAGIPVLLFLTLPILITIPMAFTKSELLVFPPEGLSLRPFVELFADTSWMASGWVSLKTAMLATLIAILVGASSSLALHRSNLPFKGFITTLVLLPVTVPGVVLALGFYLFFLHYGLTGNWVSIALAHCVVITPYVFVATQASLAGLDPSLARAVVSLGGGRFALLRYVYWPAILPGVIGGAIFAFIGSFDEVVIAMFLAGPAVVTLPVQMFNAMQTDLTPKIAAVSAMLFLLSIVGLAAQAFQAAIRSQKSASIAGK
jgi:putative spermidine/putrescine transport system permease protein